MRIEVDRGLCESNALCVGIAPHIFMVGDDDALTVLIEEPDPADLPLIESAISSCPKQALRLLDQSRNDADMIDYA
jgi:ferredoxin